jgi:hypothetical protein
MNQRAFRRVLLLLAAGATGCLGDAGIDLFTPEEDRPLPPGEVEVSEGPAMLSMHLEAPGLVSVGQQLVLKIHVRNVGRSRAMDVTPATPSQLGLGTALILQAPLPAMVDLAPDESHVFEYVYAPVDPGAIRFDVVVDGQDVSTGYAVLAPEDTLTVVVQSPPLLTADELQLPAQVLLDELVTVQLRVHNGGQATALGVRPSELDLAGSGELELLSGPTPAQVDLPGGQAAVFSWVVRPIVPGSLELSAGATGFDQHSGLEVNAAPARARPLDMDRAAALEVSFDMPSIVSAGQKLKATLLVHNSGTSPALAVLPSPALPQVSVESGTATAVPVGEHAPMVVPGGATVAFTWDVTVGGQGSLSMLSSASGEEGLSGVVLKPQMVKSTSATVMTPASLLVTEFNAPTLINRGQPFTLTMKVRNDGGVVAHNVVPAPNPISVLKGGGASAQVVQAPGPQTLQPGQTATYTWSVVENGSGVGSLAFGTAAQGTNGTTGTVVSANPTETNLVTVVTPPELLVELVELPVAVSRGQAFEARVTVKNTGGSTATQVLPALTLAQGGGAGFSVTSAPSASSIAGGAKKIFTWQLVENGTGTGSFTPTATGHGVDPATGQAISSAPKAAAATPVQAPAKLAVSTFALPAKLNRGQPFAVSMTISNTGGASAVGVLPNPKPPTATATGGVVVTTSTNVSAVTIPGGQSQTFTWMYLESGASDGTLKFTAAATGKDANSQLNVAALSTSTNVASVEMLLGCNGSQLYSGFGGRSLDGDRADALVNSNRLRIKPYSMLPAEYLRMVGITPTRIQNQGQTFNAPQSRWYVEPELSAVSMVQAFEAAFEGCLNLTSTGTQYGANPTSATANTECSNFAKKFWSRTPTATELTPCVNYAVATVNNDTNPRRRWAYVCAAVLTSTGFLAQ